MVFKVRATDTLIGMCIGVALFFPFKGVFNQGVKPYTDVEYEVSSNDLGYVINARFTKTACVFSNLDVLGTSFGYSRPLYWYDVDGPDGNREVGRHEFKLQVITGDTLSAIEVVTQHTCSGELVENVFLREDL